MKKIIIGVALGMAITLVGGFIIVKAATSITSSQVLYSNDDTTAATVKDAIDELMTKSAGDKDCPDSVILDQTCGFNFKKYKGINLSKFSGGNDYKFSGFYMDATGVRINFSNIVASDSASVYILNKVDLTNYSTLTATVINSYYGGKLAIGTTTALSTSSANFTGSGLSGGSPTGTYTIDVSSLSGEYYVGFLPGTIGNLWCQITSIVLS